MMIVRPPLPPEPHRSFFKNNEAFINARNEYRRREIERDEEHKTTMAMLIFFAILLAVTGICVVVALTYMMSGWKGPIIFAAMIGLSWAAVSRIKMWL